MEGVYEHFFYMKYYSGWSFTEFYNLPIGLRNWFVKRLSDQIEKENTKNSNVQMRIYVFLRRFPNNVGIANTKNV